MDGDIIGTPCYMPPEQALGRVAQVGPASDVYSIGALLYHVLAGRAPYVLPEAPAAHLEILRAVKAGPPARLADFEEDLPPELVSVCDKAMAREPTDRYASVTAFADDLRAYLEDRVVQAHRTGPVLELRKWVRRNRGVAYATAASIVILLGLSGVNSIVLSRKNAALRAATESAEQAGTRADRRFEEVRRLARAFVFDLDDKLQSLPGATSARDFVVDTGLVYLDRLAAEGAGDPELMHEVALGFSRIGSIQGGRSQSNLGHNDSSRMSFQKAHDILAELHRNHPERLDLHHDLATVKTHLADDDYERGLIDEALTQYREALEIGRELARLDGNPAHVRSQVVALQRTGDLHRHSAALDVAAADYAASLELTESLLVEDPTNLDFIALSAMGHQKLGSVAALRGDDDAAP